MVADRTTHPALAAVGGPVVAAGGGHRSQCCRGDIDGDSGEYWTRLTRNRSAARPLGCRRGFALAARQQPPETAGSEAAVHRIGIRRFDRLDLDALPSPTPGFSFLDHTVVGCSLVRGTPYRYIGQTLEQRPECDTWPSRWSTQVSQDQPDVALLVIGRWETVDRVNEGQWTHIGDPTFDAYLNAELERALTIAGSTGVRVVVASVPYSRTAKGRTVAYTLRINRIGSTSGTPCCATRLATTAAPRFST